MLSKLMKIVIFFGAFALLFLELFILWGDSNKSKVQTEASIQFAPVTIGSMALNVRQEGVGPDVLLIHGCPGMAEDWDNLLPEIVGNYRVTSYDRPGFGKSEGSNIEYSMDQNADIALGLIDELGLENPVVVGHSYGAAVALNMALKQPNSMKAIVLVGAAPYEAADIPRDCHILALPLVGPACARWASTRTAPKKIKESLEVLFQPDSVPSGFLNKRMKLWSRPKVLVSLSKELVHYNRDTDRMSSDYGKIHKPVYILSGKKDPDYPQAVQLKQEIPNSKLIPLDNTGHYPMVTQPEEVGKVILEAVER